MQKIELFLYSFVLRPISKALRQGFVGNGVIEFAVLFSKTHVARFNPLLLLLSFRKNLNLTFLNGIPRFISRMLGTFSFRYNVQLSTNSS